MIKNRKILIFAFIVLFFSTSCFAQDEHYFDFLEKDITILLPPLETLIDSAITNNPEVRFRELQIKVNSYKLKSNKYYFTRNLGIQTDVRFGTFDNFSTNTSEGQTPSIISTQESQINYGIGLYMKFPLLDFLDRKNQINLAKTEMDQATEMVENQQKEVRQMVIQQYNDLVLKQHLLKLKTQAIETSRINLEMVEKEFNNGITSVVEYTRIYQIVINAEADLETTRMDFVNSFMMLEEIAGNKIEINW